MASLLLTCGTMYAQQTAFTLGRFTDNWQVGLTGGVEALTTHTQVLYNLNPKGGVRLSRSLTPVLGVALQGTGSFRNKPFPGSKGFLKATNVDLLATVNMSNLMGRYHGQPRRLEFIVLGGMGWGHLFGLKARLGEGEEATVLASQMDRNAFMGRVALDVALNLGRERQWQVYIEPTLAYHLDADGDVMFNINRSCIGLMAGVNYKLPNSDGSRHQRCGRLRSQQEIDQLNQQVNELRADLKAKEAQQARDARLIKELKDKLDQLNDRSTPGFGIGD